MGFNALAWHLLVRTGLLFVTLLGLCIALVNSGYWGVTLLLLAVALAQLLALYHFVNLTNSSVAQVIGALTQGDTGLSFPKQLPQACGRELLATLTRSREQLNGAHRRQETRLRHLTTLLDSSPVPLMSIDADRHVQLHNQAARRLLSRFNVHKVADLNACGPDFAAALHRLRPGQRQLVLFDDGGEQRQLMVQATQLITGSGAEQLVSLLDIQRELEATQLQAWQDLVRILTHEMMNSITPVASLAHTAQTLVQDLQQQAPLVAEDLDDLHGAIETVARRADGLMQFVQRYRSVSATPQPRWQLFSVRELLARCIALCQANSAEPAIDYRLHCAPASLQLRADPQLLEQLLINLMHNAEQAMTEATTPKPEIQIRAWQQHSHHLITVQDNGPGIARDKLRDIFLPFYTSKTQGAGIGLALARQIMTAHGGTITASTASQAGTPSGALFTLAFTVPAANRDAALQAD